MGEGADVMGVDAAPRRLFRSGFVACPAGMGIPRQQALRDGCSPEGAPKRGTTARAVLRSIFHRHAKEFFAP
jgi:hypothetical protein